MSVIILNYNGAAWVDRCLNSLLKQTILSTMQVVFADNASTDGSDSRAAAILQSVPRNGFVLQNGSNLGYCEGNNRGAKAASGKYLFFLNNDTWLEPDCIEKLVAEVESCHADSASPLVLNYDDDTFQGNGADGFDPFGYLTARSRALPAGRIFCAPGCALLVKRSVFFAVGEFDSEFFMYADETDLGWRLALAGYTTITVPSARVHHRGAAVANPRGEGKVVEFRTTAMVRFYATRNGFLVLLKNAQNLLLGLLLPQLFWVLCEMLAVLVLTRDLGILRAGYVRAFREVWTLRVHLRNQRLRISSLRKHSDLWMLRFLKLRLGRWPEVRRMLRLGVPRVGAAGKSSVK